MPTGKLKQPGHIGDAGRPPLVSIQPRDRRRDSSLLHELQAYPYPTQDASGPRDSRRCIPSTAINNTATLLLQFIFGQRNQARVPPKLHAVLSISMSVLDCLPV